MTEKIVKSNMVGKKAPKEVADKVVEEAPKEVADKVVEEAPKEVADKVVEEAATTELATTKAPKKLTPKEEKQELADSLGMTLEELEELSGMDSLGQDDISLPYAKLISKASKNGPALGSFVLPSGKVVELLEGEFMDGFTICNITPIRTYFPVPYKAGNTFICRSFDGKVGAPDGAYAGQKCATCEFGKFGSDGSAPPCRPQYLVLASYGGELFQYIVSGINNKHFRTFVSSATFGVLGKCQNIWSKLKLRVSGELQATDNGDFPVIKYTYLENDYKNSTEEVMHLLTALKAYREFAIEHIMSSTDQIAADVSEETSADVTAVNVENEEAF